MTAGDAARGGTSRRCSTPDAVAIVGASDDPVKWGNWLARGALRGERRRAVYLVNRRGGEVLGRPALPLARASSPVAAELAVLAVPPGGARAGGRRGDRRRRAGDRRDHRRRGGRRRRRRARRALAARAREAGVVLLGPNCLGVFDAGAELELVPNDLPRRADRPDLPERQPRAGARAARRRGRARVLALRLGRQPGRPRGGRADPRRSPRHDATELIALYAEDFRDGRAFAAAADGRDARGQAGRAAGDRAHRGDRARGALAHRRARAATARAIDAACRAAGIERVRTPQELIDLADGLLRAGRVRGPAHRRAGGRRRARRDRRRAGRARRARAAAAQRRARRAQLRAGLPPTAACSNPIDLAGGGEQDIRSFDRTADALLALGRGRRRAADGLLRRLQRVRRDAGARRGVGGGGAGRRRARGSGRPLVVQTMQPPTPAAGRRCAARGVPVYRSIERAVGVLARLAARGERGPARRAARCPPAEPACAGDGLRGRPRAARGGRRAVRRARAR